MIQETNNNTTETDKLNIANIAKNLQMKFMFRSIEAMVYIKENPIKYLNIDFSMDEFNRIKEILTQTKNYIENVISRFFSGSGLYYYEENNNIFIENEKRIFLEMFFEAQLTKSEMLSNFYSFVNLLEKIVENAIFSVNMKKFRIRFHLERNALRFFIDFSSYVSESKEIEKIPKIEEGAIFV